jgi:hypothetical protein
LIDEEKNNKIAFDVTSRLKGNLCHRKTKSLTSANKRGSPCKPTT